MLSSTIYICTYICICLQYVLIFTDTTVLQNCKITSLSTGTITVSCDSPYQILVTLTCTNSCNNPMVTSIGSSPLTMRGLDPGMMYSVSINVFNNTQIVLEDLMVTGNITVMNNLGKMVQATVFVIVVAFASVICLICIPKVQDAHARGLRAYISGKYQVPILQVM